MTSAEQGDAGLLGHHAPNLPSQLRAYLSLHRAAVVEVIRGAKPQCGTRAGRITSAVYDGMLASLFLAARPMLEIQSAARMALGAVGSYGRSTLALRSDLDVRILCEGDALESQRVAEALLYPLWDIGLPIGHQIVELDVLIELARTDARTATTLLDWRHIAGEDALGARLLERAFEHVFTEVGATTFADTLERDTQARHERYGASIYLLEPDIKLGAGGLRDIDVALWAAKARWRVRRLEDLVRIGILVPREIREILEARDHLLSVRNQLHLDAERRNDRLTFDQQERLAAVFHHGCGTVGAERFMSTHYQYARAVLRAREVIVERARERPRVRRPDVLNLGGGLKLFDGTLTYANAAALTSTPSLALRLFVEAVERNVPIHAGSRDAVRRALRFPSFRQSVSQSSESRGHFLFLCSVAQETRLRRDSVLGDLHEVGLLTAMIPQFIPLVGRVHHDVYHVLTVDTHSIAAVDRLRALVRGNDTGTDSLARRLAAEMSRPRVLFLATLLHDVGKAIGRGDHSVRGAKMASTIAKRLGLHESDASDVAHLVRHHLLLYHVATRRDLEDPHVLGEVAQVVRTREGLRELYLLTFVDVATTGPEAMTTWKATLLEQLYFAVDATLRGDVSSRDERYAALRALAAGSGDQSTEKRGLRQFLESMPERYSFGTSVEQARRHARVVLDREPGAIRVALLPAQKGAAAELCVVTDDQPGLLATIAAILTANRLSVLEAQIYSRIRPDGGVEAVDLFVVGRPGGDAVVNPGKEADKIRGEIESVLAEKRSCDEIVRPRICAVSSERPTPTIATEVVVDQRASVEHTVVEVFTRDRPGLLYTLARSFRDLSLTIQLAKISTEGTRVADVFYVCEPDGTKVTSKERVAAIRERILHALEHRPSQGS